LNSGFGLCHVVNSCLAPEQLSLLVTLACNYSLDAAARNLRSELLTTVRLLFRQTPTTQNNNSHLKHDAYGAEQAAAGEFVPTTKLPCRAGSAVS
jgi:hypothetical protein